MWVLLFACFTLVLDLLLSCFCDNIPRPQATKPKRVYTGLRVSPRLESIVAKEDTAPGGRSWKLADHIFRPYTGQREKEGTREVRWAHTSSKPAPGMYFLQRGCATWRFHNLLKQCHQLGTQCPLCPQQPSLYWYIDAHVWCTYSHMCTHTQ